MSQQHSDRDRLREEVVEYLFGCHEDPQSMKERLKTDPEAQEVLKEAEAWSSVLQDAAVEPVARLHLDSPPPARKQMVQPIAWYRRRGVIAAAVFLALLVSLPFVDWRVQEVQVARLASGGLHLVVSGPRGVPDGGSGRFRVETWRRNGSPGSASIKWTGYDQGGEVVIQGEEPDAQGSFDIDVPPRLAGIRRFEVQASDAFLERSVDLSLSPVAEAPLVHLSSDKPAYQPGQHAYLRAVVLDRLSLGPWKEGDDQKRVKSYRVRVIDPKGSPVFEATPWIEDGVVATAWTIPKDASGGNYTFEFRNGRNDCTVESLPLLVRKYQTPRLMKRITLDRASYAPGEVVVADIQVERVEGGELTDASVDVELLLAGSIVDEQLISPGPGGSCVVELRVPADAAPGEGRVSARITDGGLVETTMKPFVIVTGSLVVNFYPEGGDLIAGVKNRVYVEVLDELFRPVDARGKVASGRDEAISDFSTLHQGRGWFELVPELERTYELILESPGKMTFPLPTCQEKGVVLRSEDVGTGPGDPVRLSIYTPSEGPWIAGVFCRGVLVAQDVFRGAGWTSLEVPLPPQTAGVLRVTVFDQSLTPQVERLVHRSSGRSLVIEMRPSKEKTLPGASQRVDFVTRDEDGNPVSAILGVSVADRALQDLVSEPRVGISDQTWLLADVEDLEDLPEFLSSGENAERNVDLLLGTRGWRRFSWMDPDSLLAEHGDKARRLLLREGRPDAPLVKDDGGENWSVMASARNDARTSKQRAIVALLGACLLAILFGVIVAWSKVLRRYLPDRPLLRPLLGTTLTVATLAVPCLLAFFAIVEMKGKTVLQKEDRLAFFAGGEDVDFWFAFNPKNDVEQLEVDDAVAYIQDFDVEIAQAAAIVDGPGAIQNLALMGPKRDADPAVQYPSVFSNQSLDYLLGPNDEVADLKEGGVPHRVYAHRRKEGEAGHGRIDFTETLFWNPVLRTSPQGEASITFDLSDRVTTWDVNVDAHGAARVGQGKVDFEAVPPLFLEAKLPVEASLGDRLLVPVSATVSDKSVETVQVRVAAKGSLRLDDTEFEIDLVDGKGRLLLPITVDEEVPGRLAIICRGGRHEDRIGLSLRVVPRGFPHRVSKSGSLTTSAEFIVPIPQDSVLGSKTAELTLYPSPLADVLGGIEGMLRTPHGCFEQASSVNYPNLLVLSYLRSAGVVLPSIEEKARGLLKAGYTKLTGYECSTKGYEWFGSDPGHEALSAYGLLEFHDMNQVYDVDSTMVERTRNWLFSRRDGEGGFKQMERSLDTFGAAPENVTNAYITYALAVTDHDSLDLDTELDRQESRALESKDAYEVSLAALALEHGGRGQVADTARERLKTWQEKDGSLTGSSTSITSSGGKDLKVETTSFAVLAWLLDPDDIANAEEGVRFILSSRRGGGAFGATQATITALKALTEYAKIQRRIANPGTARLIINDLEIDSRSFGAGERGSISFLDFAGALVPGENRVRIELTGDNEFPFSLDCSYQATQPANDPDCRVGLTTRLAETSIEEGKSVALSLTVENRTSEGLPMALAVVGLPAGLHAPTSILDDLKEAGKIDFWETDGRELVLYFRGIAPSGKRELIIDLLAMVPGASTGPASRTWLYYTPEAKAWVEPLSIKIDPAIR